MLRRLLLLVPVVCALTACATNRISPMVLGLAQDTKPGGSFFIEFAADGSVLGADAEIEASAIPPHLVAAANAKYPGGTVVGGEKEYGDGRLVWEVVKVIDGQAWEILLTPTGEIIGGEQALPRAAWPANVVQTALAATDGGDVTAVEKVWGPEAWGGEAYHVKVTKHGDSLRVGVNADGALVRVVRRVPGQVRVPWK